MSESVDSATAVDPRTLDDREFWLYVAEELRAIGEQIADLRIDLE